MRRSLAKFVVLLAFLGVGAGGAIAQAETAIVGTLQVSVSGRLSPEKLPREDNAPIAVSVGWNIGTTDGTTPPKLKELKIEINSNGLLDLEGLPTCDYDKIQPASTSRALANCRPALVGKGSFSAIVGLEGQETYIAEGQMLVFNGLKGGKPVLYGQIYSALPFANSFVIPFKIDELKSGTYGTALTATLPGTLRAWGNLTSIEMRLSRKFHFEGKSHSFLSAACPTPDGVKVALFKLARTSFSFVDGQMLSSTLTDSCKAKR